MIQTMQANQARPAVSALPRRDEAQLRREIAQLRAKCRRQQVQHDELFRQLQETNRDLDSADCKIDDLLAELKRRDWELLQAREQLKASRQACDDLERRIRELAGCGLTAGVPE